MAVKLINYNPLFNSLQKRTLQDMNMILLRFGNHIWSDLSPQAVVTVELIWLMTKYK